MRSVALTRVNDTRTAPSAEMTPASLMISGRVTKTTGMSFLILV